MHAISEVARRTGISPATLRKWEERYGFPRPERSAGGTRYYSDADVERLLQIRRDLAEGGRPGRLLTAVGHRPAARPNAPAGVVGEMLGTLSCQDADRLRTGLERELLSRGVPGFVRDVARPLTLAVGQGWFEGTVSIFAEHLYTRIMRGLLDEAGRRTRAAQSWASILLTTPPGESHTLGLDMVRALFTHAGAHCIDLGAQLPVPEIAAAARAYRADVVGLSFSAAFPRPQVTATLADLRGRLPDAVELWVGGSGVELARGLPPGVQRLTSLDLAMAALERLKTRT